MKNFFLAIVFALVIPLSLPGESRAEEIVLCAAVVQCDGLGGVVGTYDPYCEDLYKNQCQIEYAMAEELSVCEANNQALQSKVDSLKQRNQRIRRNAQRRFRILQRHNLVPNR